MDYLYRYDETETEFEMMRGSCSCCGGQYTTDSERQSTYTRPITEEELTTWEVWLREQLVNVIKCRARIGLDYSMFLPLDIDTAWSIAESKARRLGRRYQGRHLPGTGVNNPIQMAIECYLDQFTASLSEEDSLTHTTDWPEENYQILMGLFFEECGREPPTE